MTDETMYTLAQAAMRLGVAEHTMRRRVKAGKIRFTTKPAKYGVYDQYFISEADLSAYEAAINKPSYEDLEREVKALRRELRYLLTRLENGNVNDGDVKRARRALGDDNE